MPNNVINQITFVGEEKNVQEVLDLIKGKDTPLDFNKLIPMPESLNLVSGSGDIEAKSLFADAFINAPEKLNFLAIPTSKQVEIATYIHNKYECPFKSPYSMDMVTSYYDTEYDEYKKEKGQPFPFTAFSHHPFMLNMFNKHQDSLDKFVLELGYTYINNYIEYGANTWNQWCRTHWGTKWNAYNAKNVGNKISFITAWNFPEQIMEKLVQLCAKHNVEISALYADEEPGYNSGFFESRKGNTRKVCYSNNSQESFKTYIDLWGDSPRIGINEKGDYYRVW